MAQMQRAKPVRYLGEKGTNCSHCNKRPGKRSHMTEPSVYKQKNNRPAYSSSASSAPGSRNFDASFLATTISWKDNSEFDSISVTYR